MKVVWNVWTQDEDGAEQTLRAIFPFEPELKELEEIMKVYPVKYARVEKVYEQ